MRILLAIAFGLALLFAAANARAERRMFIISNADGYGIDRCLAAGDKCGAAAAAAYCRARQFADAASFHKVDRDEITGSIPASTSTCRGSNCDDIVAIVCSR